MTKEVVMNLSVIVDIGDEVNIDEIKIKNVRTSHGEVIDTVVEDVYLLGEV